MTELQDIFYHHILGSPWTAISIAGGFVAVCYATFRVQQFFLSLRDNHLAHLQDGISMLTEGQQKQTEVLIRIEALLEK